MADGTSDIVLAPGAVEMLFRRCLGARNGCASHACGASFHAVVGLISSLLLAWRLDVVELGILY